MQIQLIRRRRGTSTPTPPAFSPADLAGLVHWLDASALTGLTDGAPMSTWPDLSSSGLTATATGGGRPVYRAGVLNGQAGVEVGNLTEMNTSAPATVAVDNFTQIVLAKPGVAEPGGWCPVFNGSGADGWGVAAITSIGVGGGAGWLRGGVAWHSFAPSTLTARVLVGRRQAGTFTLRVGGGAAVGSNPDAPVPPTTRVRVGSHSGGAPTGSLIYETLIYDRALTNAELDQLGAYLAAKWGITWSPVS
jgi:hypothetical protein